MSIKPMNPLLGWVGDLLNLLSKDVITTPTEYAEQVVSIKKLLQEDVSGIANTLLDFAVDCGNVKYSLGSPSKEFSDFLNMWLKNINIELLGEIPIGINALAKEYFRERWKGSSFLILRTLWEKKGKYEIPTKMWFVDGKDIEVKNGDGKTKTIGNKKYFLKYKDGEEDQRKLLPAYKNENIFVQLPFSSWSDDYPIPYVIQKGLYKNLMFLSLLEEKGEVIVAKALEYIGILRKGRENLALTQNPDFIYGEDDLKKIKQEFEVLVKNRNTTRGLTNYVTNFDTEYEHIIPEYTKAVSHELFVGVEKRILGGLGFVDVLQGSSSTRKESVLSPRPFIAEVESGIYDFKNLISSVIKAIIIKNDKIKNENFEFYNTPIKSFMDRDFRSLLRSIYDRGNISKRTLLETVGDLDYELELERVKEEKDSGEHDLLHPPAIQNQENQNEDRRVSEEKISIEKKNFNQSKEYEESPYKKLEDLPYSVKNNMSKSLQKVWLDAFNTAYEKHSEEEAFKIAWSVIKDIAEKNKEGIWKKKKK